MASIAGWVAQGQAVGRGAAGRHGLVPQQTSVPRGFEIKPREARLQRMRRGVRVGGGILQAVANRPGFRSLRPVLFTFTYAEPDAWRPRHLSECARLMRKYWNRRGWPWLCVWVAEVQPGRYRRTGKAVVHYHAVCWLPVGEPAPKPDALGWWAHGMTNRQEARSPVGYLLKYASKGDECAKFPKGLRLFGMAGLGEFRPRYTWSCRPGWLRARTGVGDKLARCPGGGWIDRETGEVHQSPYFVVVRDGCVFVFLRDSDSG